MIRSDLLSSIPDEVGETLYCYGMRTVVDLRTTEETLRWPCSLADDVRFDYHHHNLEGDEPVPDYHRSQENHPLAQSYAALLAARRSVTYLQRWPAAFGRRPCSSAPVALTVRE